jgi:predicted dehydrogenase
MSREQLTSEVQTRLRHIAVIGLGSMGNRYVKLLDDLEVHPTGVHLVDVDAQRLKERLCGSSVTSVDEMIKMRKADGGLDAMVVSTPASTHLMMLNKLSAAFPTAAILVEKPLTGEVLEDAALPSELFTRCIAVGYNWRFHPTAVRVKNLSGEIQNVTLYVADEMNTWPGTYGAPLYEFSHELDLISWWTRNPVVEAATMNGSYYIQGVHEQGNWRVIIRPHHQPKGRWARIQMKDGSRLNFSWNRKRRVVESTYHDQLVDLIDTWEAHGDPSDLTCSLADGVRTSHLIDEVMRRC